MPIAELRYLRHFRQLSAIVRAVEHGIAAEAEREKRLRREETTHAEIADALGQIRDGILGFGQSLRPKAIAPNAGIAEIEDTLQELADSIAGANHAGEQMLNLGVVMMCTQLDIFISHLLHITLAAEPRLLPQLAPNKEIKLREAAKRPDYESLMDRFREGIVNEIMQAEAKEKFTKHLGERLGLLEPFEIKVAPLVPDVNAEDFRGCDMEMVIRLYDERRRLVHGGEFTVRDMQRLKQVQLLFQAVETVLTINAVRKYAVPMESHISAALACACGKSLFGVPQKRLDEFMRESSLLFR